MNLSERDLRYQDIKIAMAEQRFKDAETMSIEIIKLDPSNAQGWVFLGEALMLQGYKETATKVFDRAWLLDPQATWVTSIFPLLDKLKEDMPRLDIEMMMELPHVTVSAAMIVNNEERRIARCLDRLSEAVDEIIIVDTGSTDATLSMIQQYPKVKVYTYDGDGDVGQARNEALKYVTSDWIIGVDADEYLMEQDIHCIREAAALFSRSVKPAILNTGRFSSIEGSVQLSYNESRMFPANRGIQYYGRVYPQIVGKQGMYEGEFLRASVRIRFYHDEHESDIDASRGKAELRIKQLQLMVEEQPNEPGWWLLYGREILQQGNSTKALEHLLEAERLEEVTPSTGRMVEIQMLLAQIYITEGLSDLAEAACRKALILHPDYPDAHYTLAHIETMRSIQLVEEAKQLLAQAKHSASNYRGLVEADGEIARWKADDALAEAAGLEGNLEEAMMLQRGVHPYKRSIGGTVR